jgi:hypothetical protein
MRLGGWMVYLIYFALRPMLLLSAKSAALRPVFYFIRQLFGKDGSSMLEIHEVSE